MERKLNMMVLYYLEIKAEDRSCKNFVLCVEYLMFEVMFLQWSVALNHVMNIVLFRTSFETVR
jgi:hypothetical protein